MHADGTLVDEELPESRLPLTIRHLSKNSNAKEFGFSYVAESNYTLSDSLSAQ